VMLLALLLGMAMNFLSSEGACVSGIEFTVRTVLRCGVALLGLRITLAQVAALGWQPVTLVLLSVMLTIGSGIVAARALGFRTGFGLLSGGATAICGASAALAIAAALPSHPLKERATLFTVLGVSALSSLAMITYPLLTHVIGLDAKQAGVFLGATIHDVAQVVGAGYSISPETGDVATLVKLLRVAMLMPVIAITVMSYRHAGAEPGVKRPPPLPGFVVAFAGFALLHSFDRHSEQTRGVGFRRIAMVSRRCRCCPGHQDAPPGARKHRIEANRADVCGNPFPDAARFGALRAQI